MFKQLEYSEILFKNLFRKFNRCAHDQGSTYNDSFPAQPSGKVSGAQQVVIFVNTFKKKLFLFSNQNNQFYCFIASINLRQQ